jgi:hypothetical protein
MAWLIIIVKIFSVCKMVLGWSTNQNLSHSHTLRLKYQNKKQQVFLLKTLKCIVMLSHIKLIRCLLKF